MAGTEVRLMSKTKVVPGKEVRLMSKTKVVPGKVTEEEEEGGFGVQVDGGDGGETDVEGEWVCGVGEHGEVIVWSLL
jgi:hypothetical protein